jgi:hypothetical protein
VIDAAADPDRVGAEIAHAVDEALTAADRPPR